VKKTPSAWCASGCRKRWTRPQRGEPVFIQRQGVEYRLTVVPAQPRRKKAALPRIEIVDPALAAGQWTWDSTASGQLKFRSRRR